MTGIATRLGDTGGGKRLYCLGWRARESGGRRIDGQGRRAGADGGGAGACASGRGAAFDRDTGDRFGALVTGSVLERNTAAASGRGADGHVGGKGLTEGAGVEGGYETASGRCTARGGANAGKGVTAEGAAIPETKGGPVGNAGQVHVVGRNEILRGSGGVAGDVDHFADGVESEAVSEFFTKTTIEDEILRGK